MPLRVLALALGVALAPALVACGGDDEPQGAALTQPPLAATTQATAPATTAATTPTQTTTAPPTTPTTATTPTTSTQSSGGAPATTPTTPSPSAGGAPAGCPGAVGGFIRDVRASGTDCAVAGEVATAWFDAIDGGAAPDAPITAAGFACSGTLAGQIASVTCSGKGGTVTFTASP